MSCRVGTGTNTIVRRTAIGLTAVVLLMTGCASDGDYDNVSTSVSVGVGYGSYYGPGWYGGYYEPYPPVVVVPPGDWNDRPNNPGDRPRPTPHAGDGVSTMPANRPSTSNQMSTAPSRPSNVDRATSRPSARPAPRPMPRSTGMGRRR